MKSDIEIAQSSKLELILKVAKRAGFKSEEIELYGKYKAKINLSALKRLQNKKDGKLILVTTMSPTPQGEGKTTTVIGLAQALKKIGKKSFICIREPSLGPVMGMKGGAAGGGYSQVLPMEDINLHFTGDIHNVTAAHNLLTAMIYNHIYQGNELSLDENRIVWNRVMDMNDRALRGSFAITASSEIMAIMCLSENLTDMKERLSQIVIGYKKNGEVALAYELKAQGAMALLLKDALKPNIVQSIEGVPAFVHGGPFANIAHGCNAITATKLALKSSDYVVTEAGFGSDLGAEKFFDIKCRQGKLNPSAVVLVITHQAYIIHGIENIEKHVETLKMFGVLFVIAINKKKNDADKDLINLQKQCEKFGVNVIISEVWEKGGNGGRELAKAVVEVCKKKSELKFLYDLNESISDKINHIAQKAYGAEGVVFSDKAKESLTFLEKSGYSNLPICVAKTQYSLSDDSKLCGCPRNFKITVRELSPSAGAGYIVAYCGNIMTMPGLPKHPAACDMDVTEDGKIIGLF
ncbi:formate--tetrahydrofolate ligase [candidate division WOR-1 bacterium RIFOXYC2_FULL_37_10]|nr:MAG: formate--tetrahydrofolate ligase [candidate division WOR-1 bacterium RIFOXYC2_FULL_37_10]